MSVQTCTVPSQSALDRNLVETAYFKDAYRAPVKDANASVVEMFFAIFGHHPWWIKAPLLIRNAAAKVFGLDVPDAQQILKPVRAPNYAVGDTIGPWPIFHISQNELIAGRNNAHLDFRLSILKRDPTSVVVSTICNTHNWQGKAYLKAIVPFHVWGVQWLMRTAIKEGRL